MKLINKAVLLIVFIATVAAVVFADPTGPTGIDTGDSSTYDLSTGGSSAISAYAGNVTRLDINGTSITTGWQGYFGNVLGTIVLGDSSNKTMYDWSITSPGGEIYSSRASSITWADVECASNANMTAEETALNFGTSSDGINETFTATDATGFYIGTRQLTNCLSTTLHNSTGDQSSDWVEDILVENSTGSIVYTSIVNDNGNGFNGSTFDFQMIVAEDGHAGDVLATNYYFWAELE